MDTLEGLTFDGMARKKLVFYLFHHFVLCVMCSGFLPSRVFTILYISVRSPRFSEPRSHANSLTGAIFVYIASATWREDDNTPRHWGGLDAYFSCITAPNTHIPDTIVVFSPGCARNINKDGGRFGVRLRWRSYGKIEDGKQSTNQNLIF